MTSGIYFPVCCLFFSITIMLIYFSKQRLQNIENQIYKVLLISNFIGLINTIYLNTFSDNKKKYNGLKELIPFVLQNVTRVIHKNKILFYN